MDIQTAPQPWTRGTPLTGRTSALRLAEEGIRDTCDQVADAWCRGDAITLSAALAPDCDHLTLTRVRHVKRGRPALVESWQEAFAKRGPGFSVRMAVAPHLVRLMSDDFALVDGAFEYTEGIGAADTRHGRSSQPFTAVMIRAELEWLILALRVGPCTTAAKVVPCPDEASS